MANPWGRFRPAVSWFPGHMAKASKEMQSRLKACDLVIEVKDARLPLSSSNPNLEAMLGNKTRLELFNKADLADARVLTALKYQCEREGRHAVFVSSSSGRGIPEVLEWTQREARRRFKSGGALVMVAGMPNVGKSTLINSLAAVNQHRSTRAARHLARVGPRPGVTRNLASVLVRGKRATPRRLFVSLVRNSVSLAPSLPSSLCLHPRPQSWTRSSLLGL